MGSYVDSPEIENAHLGVLGPLSVLFIDTVACHLFTCGNQQPLPLPKPLFWLSFAKEAVHSLLRHDYSEFPWTILPVVVLTCWASSLHRPVDRMIAGVEHWYVYSANWIGCMPLIIFDSFIFASIVVECLYINTYRMAGRHTNRWAGFGLVYFFDWRDASMFSRCKNTRDQKHLFVIQITKPGKKRWKNTQKMCTWQFAWTYNYDRWPNIPGMVLWIP